MGKQKRRKMIFTTLATALTASAVVPTATLAVESNFPDVPEDHVYYSDIKALADTNVISGFPDGEFKMGEFVTRAEASQMLAKLRDLNASASTPFSDVKEDAWYTDSINALYQAGDIKGYGDDSFAPNKEITRAELAQIVVEAYDIPDADTDVPFEDVKAGAWYESSIKTLYANGLISGQNATTFGPSDKMKRGDAAHLLANVERAFGDGPAFELSIMHTNDTHASLDDMPKTVTAVKQVREEKTNSLLLNAGDVFSGTLYFNEFEGEADLKLMNLMGYDAMTFGNHEFDLGSSEEGHQALVDFIEGAQFPFVSSNVDFSKDDRFTGLFSDLVSSEPENGKIYNGIIKEVDGEKVGIFGLTTPETADIASPGEVTFEDYIEEAEKAVTAFEGQGVDKIIALTHIGYDDNAAVDNDLTLAEEVEGIDVIVGGHTHTELAEPVVVAEDETPTVIVQTGANNSNLGVVDVAFDENGVVVGHAGELISIGDQEADEEAVEVLKPFKERVDEVSEEEIGVSTSVELENPRTGDEGNTSGESVRKNETVLGNLITDGMLAKAKDFTGKNVIMALQNGGGIRAAIDAGPITVGEVITVLPFGNTLATMDITGAELKEAFERSVKSLPDEDGGFLHVAGGKVEFDSSQDAGERVVSISYINEDGSLSEIQDDETYTIATNAFTAQGGDDYKVFADIYAEGRVTDLGLSDWENLREHLVSLDSIPTETEGRIVDVAGTDYEEDDNTSGGGGSSSPGNGSDNSNTEPVEVDADGFGGTYDSDIKVDVSGVNNLKDATIKGDLALTGITSGNINFENITVEGDLDLSGLEGDSINFNGITVAGETIL